MLASLPQPHLGYQPLGSHEEHATEIFHMCSSPQCELSYKGCHDETVMTEDGAQAVK